MTQPCSLLAHYRPPVVMALVALLLVSCAAEPDHRPANPPTPAQPSPVVEQEDAPPASVEADLKQLRRLVSRRRAELPARTFQPGALPQASASLEESYLALAALQVEKASDCLREPFSLPVVAAAFLTDARTLLDAKSPNGPPGIASRGLLSEQAYFARNDNSPQPYFVFTPHNRKKGPVPLVIILHGWVPETCRLLPWLVTDDIVELAEKYGLRLVMPHGRTNTDFQYAGETDVLRVLAEMRKFYDIDNDRVYLVGPSMGGAGVWQIGMHHPDLFACLAPINAQGDWFLFWHRSFGYPERSGLPSHVQRLFAMHNPIDLAQNLSTLFSYSQHATSCFLGVDHTKNIVRKLARVKAPHAFLEDPSELGHHIYLEAECWERAFNNVLKHRRNPDPRTIRYVTSSLRFSGSYWAHIDRLTHWGGPASFVGEVSADGDILLTSSNVASMTVAPPAKWASRSGTFNINWNGHKFPNRRPDKLGSISISLPTAPLREDATPKSRSVCGPASDVFNFPFIVVRGTTGSPADTKRSQAMSRRFADDWYGYAEGRVRIIRDIEVTDAIMKQYGLVLIGPPEGNAVILKIRDSLPMKLSRNRVELPGGKVFSGSDLGLVLTYPNPLASDRYILILDGIPWGAARSNNHKFDLLPDFAIFTADAIPTMNINRFHAAGFFDEYWQYAPNLTDFADGQNGASLNTEL